ncbi:hypothetical protein BRD22_06325 [Halobacteriales archaeon SW_8_68_21]|nr:MAG: hypothetical protein BRD22_06325 [Halobacteriales archaeon SW_8_68_21]
MRRFTRSELASRVGPRPPSDAFWRRAIDRGEAALAVGAYQEALRIDEASEHAATDHAFVVVGADQTEIGGWIYRMELVAGRDEN